MYTRLFGQSHSTLIPTMCQGVPKSVRATSGGYGSITQLAEGDPKYIQYCTVSTSITTHLAEGDPKRTSLRNPYGRVDTSEGAEAWEVTVQYT